MMKALLASHVVVQRQGGVHDVTVELGTCHKEHVNIKVPVAMIIGDMQDGDKHCGSKIGYSKDLARLCRQCNIAGDESGDPLVKCGKMSMVKIRQYVLDGEVDILKAISQNNVYLAWFDVCFGGCQRRIFSAAMPVEALHALEGGLMKDVTLILYKVDLKSSICGQLDILVGVLCYLDRQHFMSLGGTKTMPRILFNDGVTSLANLPSSHVVSVLLTIIAVSLTDDGKALLEKALTPQDENPAAGVHRLNDMRYVFSLLISYWSWLKQETFWKCGGDAAAENCADWAIRKMLA
jgi:hypothetical protein